MSTRPANKVRTAKKNGGRHTVTYRDSRGRTTTAVVIGAGSSSGLKLRVNQGLRKVVVDNVAPATSQHGTGYFLRYNVGSY